MSAGTGKPQANIQIPGQDQGMGANIADAMTRFRANMQGQQGGNQDQMRQMMMQQLMRQSGMNPMIQGLMGQSMQMKPGNYGNRTLPPDVAEALKKKLQLQQNPTPESQVQVPGQGDTRQWSDIYGG